MAIIVTRKLIRPRRLLGAAAVVAGLLTDPTSASAQSLAAVARASTEARAADGAEGFVRHFHATLRSRNWNEVARLMHPAALAEFRAILRPVLMSTDPKASEVRLAFTGSDSAVTIDAMPDAAFFTAVTSRVFALMPKDVTDTLFTSAATVIGSVAENADTTHVVCRVRMSMGGATATVMEVVTARRTADGWAAMLDGSFAAAFRELGARARP